MIQENLYNAFTKISPYEKTKITNFLFNHLGESTPGRQCIQEALEYAVKDCPSFGGFVMTAELNDHIICTAIINDTGMGNYFARYVMVLFAVDPTASSNVPKVAQQLLRRAASYAKGDIILRLSPDNPALSFIEDFGYEATHVEMKLAPLPTMAVAR